MVERVRAAAAELGYRPNAAGRQLRLQRTHLIEFAVADIGNPVYVEMLSAIHGVLAPHGYRIVVSSIGDAAASAARVLSSLDDGHVDGVIISPLRVDAQFIEHGQRVIEIIFMTDTVFGFGTFQRQQFGKN